MFNLRDHTPKYGFYIEQEDAERIQASARSTRVNTASIIDPAAVGCDHCTLKATWSHIRTKCMPMSGNTKNAEILFLGEGPGEEEDHQGRAFVGQSGQLLRENIPGGYLKLSAFQNVVRCRPDGNRTPTPRESHACSTYLGADIDSLPNLRVIVGVGAEALHKYFPGASIIRVHGTRMPVMTAHGPVWFYPILHPSFVTRLADDYDGDGPAMPVFKADMQRLFSGINTWEAPFVYDIRREDVTIVHSSDEALSLVSQMQEPIGIDIEASCLHPYQVGAKLLTTGISDGNITIAFSCEHPEGPTDWGLDVLIQVLLSKRWIAHSAAFELAWFNWYWPDYVTDIQPFEDSMALGRLYHQRNTIMSLEHLSIVHLGTNIKSIVPVDAARIMEFPLVDVLPYNGLDALGSILLYHHLRNEVNEDNYQRILGAIIATTDMELIGLPIDLKTSASLKAEWQHKHDEIVKYMVGLKEVKQFERERAMEFNVQSNDHIGVALTAYSGIDLPRTPGLKKIMYKTDEETLSPYVAKSNLAKAVLDEREARKMVSTYIDPILIVPKRYIDARLHGGYTTMRTHPFRLSSEDPNMQNWPSHKPEHRLIKKQIVAEPGCVMVKIDYGQLQVRIIGMDTKDKHLCKILIDGLDMHTEWLNRILGYYPDYWYRLIEKTGEKDEKEIRKGGRNLIKSDFVFANFFGASVYSVSERTGIPQEIVQNVMVEFWAEFKQVLNWINARRREYRETGSVTTITGHVRRGLMTGNEPINAPIQFGEAVIVMDAMNELARMAREYKDRYLSPRIQIHDDLTFMLPNNNDFDLYLNTIKDVMLKVRYPWIIVPLNIEASVGPSWGDSEQFATFVGQYNEPR